MSAVAGLAPHPLRDRVLGEVHARPFAPLPIPCRIRHFAFQTDPQGAAADRAALERWCASLGVAGPGPDARHCRIALDDRSLRWESHNEFTTYSWELHGDGAAGDAFSGEAPGWPAGIAQPGPLIGATDVHLLPAGANEGAWHDLFEGPEAAISEIGDGAAVIATDFRVGADGFIRIAVFARTLEPGRAGPLVQRLLEIDTYRTLALLGLPEAQRIAPRVMDVESALPPIMDRIRQSAGLADNRALLDRLSVLAAELEAVSASSSFRFGATRAYFELVRLRLNAIDESAMSGGTRWAAFLSRRLNPALRTCTSIQERQADLSRKLTRATQLLRTRVEVDLASQNRDLLEAMNERVRLQTRLQQTVEGLSVVAISYYAVSLLHLLLDGARHAVPAIDPELGTAIAVLPILLGVGFAIRLVRRRQS